MTVLRTERLVLRPWTDDDLDAYAAIVAHPEVTRHLGPKTREEAAAQLERFKRAWREDGAGIWAAEHRESGELVGRIGLLRQHDWAVDPGALEVGWLLARSHWGRGLATEGGRASLAYAFETLGVPRVISLTRPSNHRSRAVMERLGLTHRGEGEHQGMVHVWYAVDRAKWRPPARRLGHGAR